MCNLCVRRGGVCGCYSNTGSKGDPRRNLERRHRYMGFNLHFYKAGIHCQGVLVITSMCNVNYPVGLDLHLAEKNAIIKLFQPHIFFLLPCHLAALFSAHSIFQCMLCIHCLVHHLKQALVTPGCKRDFLEMNVVFSEGLICSCWK